MLVLKANVNLLLWMECIQLSNRENVLHARQIISIDLEGTWKYVCIHDPVCLVLPSLPILLPAQAHCPEITQKHRVQEAQVWARAWAT